MACGGGCGCNDCGAERSVVTTCAPEPGCRVPGDAVASLPQHPAGGVKPRERSGSRTPPGGVTARVAGEVRGSLTPPQAQPAREAPGPREAEQARVPAGEPGPQRPAESPDLDPAAESPEADVLAASPEGQPAARSPGRANLDHARRELPGVDLGPSQKRGKGGGGAGEVPPGTPAGSPPGGGASGPKQGHNPECDLCNCRCESAASEAVPGAGGAPSITPRMLWGPDGLPVPIDLGPMRLTSLRAPPMSGLGTDAEATWEPSSMAEGAFQTALASRPGLVPASGAIDESGEAVSFVRAVEDESDMGLELALAGTDVVLRPRLESRPPPGSPGSPLEPRSATPATQPGRSVSLAPKRGDLALAPPAFMQGGSAEDGRGLDIEQGSSRIQPAVVPPTKRPPGSTVTSTKSLLAPPQGSAR